MDREDGRARRPARLNRDEVKISGFHAVLAVFDRREEDIVKVYVTQERVYPFSDPLRRLAATRRAYHIVEPDELERVSGTEHHEGVCAIVRRRPKMSPSELLARLQDTRGPIDLLVLDGVENPHNIGAVMRVAAHFGSPAILVDHLAGEAGMPPALYRTAEGGAEYVELVEVGNIREALLHLKRAGFLIVATSSHVEQDLYQGAWPSRVAWVLGGEHDGISEEVAEIVDTAVAIPGTGRIESLNVATATAIVLAEARRSRLR
ncbi:MAG: tRNA/rRNA methyltransferase [Myxococcales bacterium]|nr:tRNA/rRNA methyltransferase [Myxococcales bacterium]